METMQLEKVGKGYIREQLEASEQVLRQLLSGPHLDNVLMAVASACVRALGSGGKLLFAGNGGSAGDAQHIAGEFVSRVYFNRPPLSAIALTTDTSILTSIGNDYGYEHVFSRQVEALGRKGDVLFGLSTSGNSPNILLALKVARDRGMVTVGMTGETGGKMAEGCDYILKVPSQSVHRIQEMHGLLGHVLCATIERELFS